MSGGRVRVLLVEDDDEDYLLTKELFAEFGSDDYHLDRVADYDSALQAFRDCNHDVYLIDYRLGKKTGLELLEEAKSLNCHAPRIMLTGQTEHEVDLSAMQAGAVDYLVKDRLDAATLERSLRYGLRQRHHEQAVQEANQLLEQRVLERTAELARANQALRESEDRYRVLLESAGEGIFGLDRQGRCTFINRAACSLLGFERDELLGRELHDIVLRHTYPDGIDDPSQPACSMVRAARQGVECRSDQETFFRRDGSSFPVEYSCYPLLGEDGHRGAVVTFTDVTERRRAEEALRLSRERLDLVVKSTEIGLWFCDLPFDRLQWNDICKRHFGLVPEAEVTIDTFFEHIHPEDRETTRAAIEHAIATGDEYDIVYRTLTDDGVRWIRAIGRRFVDESETPRRFDGVTIDVTEEKRSEAVVAESRRFLRSVLDALPSHIAVLDDVGDIVAVNDAWRRFAADNNLATREYGVGHNYLQACESMQSDACHPDSGVAGHIREVIEGTREAFQTEYPCHSENERRWFQMRVSPFREPGPTRVVVVHDNITARVLSESALRRRSGQLQELARIATHVNVAQDIESIIGIVTRAAREVIGAHLGAAVQGVEGEPGGIQTVSLSEKYDAWRSRVGETEDFLAFHEVRRENRTRRLTRVDTQANAAWQAWNEQVQSLPPFNGWLAAPLVGRKGRNLGIVHLSDRYEGDFTEEDEAILVQLAQMASVAIENSFLFHNLREVDRRKDQFLATLAHELRNPLSSLIAASQLIGMDPHDTEQIRELSGVIARQLEQLNRLIDDLLDISRISSGKLHLQLQPIGLEETIAAALDVVRPLMEVHKHDLRVLMPTKPIVLLGDRVRLSQAIGNLLVNAAKYTPPGGRIVLEVLEDGGQVCVSVRDSGIGIPREMLDKIFGLFMQVDSSNTRSQGGLGIGLTLVKTLVEMHGGTIKVTSAGTNQGSEFTIRIPLADLQTLPAAGPKITSDEVPATAYRILVVDDNESASHLLSRLLRKLKQEVEVSSSVGKAIEILPVFRPQIVISDIAMPGESGYDLARRIRRSTDIEQPLLIALTGYGQENDRQAAISAGFDHHLTKPIGLPALRQLLQSLPRRRE